MDFIQQIEIKHEPIYSQITNRIRGLIADGKIPVGSKLPPIRDLATQWSTNYATVHGALGTLVEEGILERAPRRGTVVKRRGPLLKTAGIYFGADFWGSGMDFYRSLHQELLKQFSQKGIRHKLWLDGRSDAEQKTPLADLQQAIENREIQALIAGIASEYDLVWLKEEKIPLTILSTETLPYQVWFDLRQMLELGLKALKNQGCRTVGIMAPFSVSGTKDKGLEIASRKFYTDFTDLLADFGLQTRKEWVCSLEAEHHGHPNVYEEMGRRCFYGLWKKNERPDGLLVYPDIIARGVVMAILELGVQAPKDLKLVFHRNQEVGFPCSLPASWVVLRAADVADALIGQINKQLDGQTVEPVSVPYALEEFSQNPLNSHPENPSV